MCRGQQKEKRQQWYVCEKAAFKVKDTPVCSRCSLTRRIIWQVHATLANLIFIMHGGAFHAAISTKMMMCCAQALLSQPAQAARQKQH